MKYIQNQIIEVKLSVLALVFTVLLLPVWTAQSAERSYSDNADEISSSMEKKEGALLSESDLNKLDARTRMLIRLLGSEPQKMKVPDPHLQRQSALLMESLDLKTGESDEPLMRLLVKTDGFPESLESADRVDVLGVYGDVASVQVPLSAIVDLAARPSVKRIETIQRRKPLNNNANEDTGVDRIHDGTGLPLSYRGNNVIVGIVDTGIDFSHPDFSDSDGNTRILYIRETTDDGETLVWNSSDIDSNPDEITQVDVDGGGHGTHVSGTAAGGGQADSDFIGAAPEAHIISVKTSFADDDILSGVQFIFDKADSLGLPAVANLSLGGHSGPHDGTSLLDVALSNLVGPGRIVTAAAGNEGADNIHLGYETSGGSSDEAMLTLMDFWDGFTTLEVYFDESDDIRFGFMVDYNDEFHYTESFGSEDEFGFDSIVADEDTLLAYFVEFATSGDVTQAYIQSSFETLDEEDGVFLYTYGEGAFNAWVVQGDWFDPHTDATERIIGGDTRMTVGEPATALGVISVGAHVTRDSWTDRDGDTWAIHGERNEIAGFSSRGPSRDGRMLPHFTAPGEMIISTFTSHIDLNENEDIHQNIVHDSDDFYAAFQGTSMATPHVTGIIALMLEADPDLDNEDVLEILQSTARRDAFTGDDLPDNTWGAGKVDALSAMGTLETSISDEPVAAGPDSFILHENYPNPFNPATTLRFELGIPAPVTLSVYDMLGRRVAVLVDGQAMPAGMHRVNFDASSLSSGVYLLHMKAEGQTMTRKMMLMK